MKRLIIFIFFIFIYASCTFSPKTKENSPDPSTGTMTTPGELKEAEKNDASTGAMTTPEAPKEPQGTHIALPDILPPRDSLHGKVVVPASQPGTMKAKTGIGAKAKEMQVHPPDLDTISVH